MKIRASTVLDRLPICNVSSHFLCVAPMGGPYAKSIIGYPSDYDSCKENCTSVSISNSVSTAKIPMTTLETMEDFLRLKAETAFYAAMEARSRNQESKKTVRSFLMFKFFKTLILRTSNSGGVGEGNLITCTLLVYKYNCILGYPKRDQSFLASQRSNHQSPSIP